MRVLQLGSLVTLIALTASSAFAHSDVLLRSSGTKVLIGAAEDLDMEEGGPFFDLDTNVFEGVLLNPAVPTPPFNYDFERDEPGFYSDSSVPVGQNLPANADVSLSEVTISLASGTDTTFYWDGSGAVDFQPLSSVQPSADFTFAPSSPDPFASTDGSSFVDDHPLFGLTGGAADGVYLTALSAEVDGLEASDTFYMVWLADSTLVLEDEAEAVEEALELFEEDGTLPIVGGVNYEFFEEAVEFAEGIPEPSALALFAFAMAGAAATRR